MIRIVLTIEEEVPGVIRFRGRGGNKNNPSSLEVDFATRVMKAVDKVKSDDAFQKKVDIIPLTIITQNKKKQREKSEHKDRN